MRASGRGCSAKDFGKCSISLHRRGMAIWPVVPVLLAPYVGHAVKIIPWALSEAYPSRSVAREEKMGGEVGVKQVGGSEASRRKRVSSPVVRSVHCSNVSSCRWIRGDSGNGEKRGSTNCTPQRLSDSQSKRNEICMVGKTKKDKNKKLRRKMRDTNSPSVISHASICEWRHRVLKPNVNEQEEP